MSFPVKVLEKTEKRLSAPKIDNITNTKRGGNTMMKGFTYDNQTQQLKEITDPKQILSAISDKEKTTWVDLTKPSHEEVKLLEEGFHFHPIIVASSLKEGERSKFYDYDNYSFLVMEAAIGSGKGSAVKLSEFSAFLSENYLVTVHLSDLNFVEDTAKTIKDQPDLLKKGLGFLLYNLLDGLIAEYFPILDKIDNKLKTIEERIFQRPDKQVLNEIFKLRQEINRVRKSVSNNLDVLSLMLRHDSIHSSEENRMYFMDLYDHLMHLLDITDMYHDMVFTSMDAYLSSVSNNMNNVMKVLTAITTIMMPLTVITGLYGMNFDMPEYQWQYGYLWAIMLMVVSVIAMALFLRSRKWL